jgi:hypothetical protein
MLTPLLLRPLIDLKGDYKPPPSPRWNSPRFSEAFNFSVIPFSGQWGFIEPQMGKPTTRTSING